MNKPKIANGSVQNEKGFTIIELLLATAIFSLVLAGAAAALIQIGRMYYKGVTTASTQEVSRRIMNDISRGIQFAGPTPTNAPGNERYVTYNGQQISVYSFCIGSLRYSYVLDGQLSDKPSTNPGDKQFPHVLWRDTMRTSASSCPPVDITQPDPNADAMSNKDGQEMMSPHMRLSRFTVSDQANSDNQVYKTEVWVVYGDEDVLDRDSVPGHIVCGGGSVVGSQFCALAELSNNVTRRLR